MKTKMTAVFALLLSLVLLGSAMLLSACGDNDKPEAPKDTQNSDATGKEKPDVVTVTAKVTLNGSTVSVDGEGASFENGRLSITKEGVYEMSGTLEDGQIYINVQKTEKVELYFKGVNITCSTSSAIYCDSADKLVIRLEEGTQNSLTDGAKYQYETADPEDPTDDLKPNACVYSDDDISIKGTGALTVVGNYKNGISSKNDIKFADATVTVNAVNTGVRGKDSVTVESGNITVTAGKDGLKSSTFEQGKGYLLISGGTVNITVEDDALQAENDISITGGSVTVQSGGKNINCPGTQTIADGCLIER